MNSCFWKSELQCQIHRRKVIPEFYYPLKAFSILNFAMMECLFFFQTYFYHKNLHIKWDVVISSSLWLLMKVWIWYRWQSRIENCYHHDGKQLGFYKMVDIKTQSKKEDVLAILTLQEANESQFISQKLYSRERAIAYSTWRKFT